MKTPLAVLALALPLIAQSDPDLRTTDRIRHEAFDRSKVMDHLYYLTDVNGPRLTGSPEFEQAADWAMARLKEYGLSNVHVERWGPFGRRWSVLESSFELLEPRYGQLTAAPLAWSRGTNGPTGGDLILAPMKVQHWGNPKAAAETLAAYRKQWTGKLRGKVVLLTAPKTVDPESVEANPWFRRYTDAQLGEMAAAPTPVPKYAGKLEDLQFPEDREDLGKLLASLPDPMLEQLWEQFDRLIAERARFFNDEGVAAVVMEDQRSHDGLLNAEAAGSWKASEPLAPPTFVVTAEQYNRIARLVEKKAPVRVRFNLKVSASDADVDGWNIVGEIPGGARQDEVVMIGGHFDSWHTGTGATDNAAGCAVMIEVMRVLKALNLKLDRTVRIALWSGEEQGLLGSRAYVKQHFADPATMKETPEYARLSGYFNLDNGSGKVRGVYLQGDGAMRPLFERWLAPFRDMGATTITIRDTGGTDHLSFDAVGLPGFQFIQDPLDYGSVTHHSDMDVYDHAIPGDLMQAAAVIANVVYQAANLDSLLPRPAR